MDFDDWELIPDDGFLGFRDDSEKKILYRKWTGSDPKGVLNDYFRCPLTQNNSRKVRENPGTRPSQLVPVSIPIPIQLNPTSSRVKSPDDQPQPVKETTKVVVVEPPNEKSIQNFGSGSSSSSSFESDQDSVSKVFFKKMKENESFVDMKMDSPKSPTTRGFIPQIDAAAFNFDDKVEGMENMSSPRMVNMKNSGDLGMEDDGSDGGLNIWKLSLTGIGAICSFGIAAATICILFFGSHHRNKQLHQNHKIRFQIYNDDKVRIFLLVIFQI